MIRTNEKGFTLVETIVVVALVGVLVGAGYTFFFVLTKEKAEVATSLKAQIQTEVLFDAIGQGVRNADFILDKRVYDTEANYKIDPSSTALNLYSDSVFFYRNSDTAGKKNSPVGGLYVKRGSTSTDPVVIQEWIPSKPQTNDINGSWKTIFVSGDSVQLVRDSLGIGWSDTTAFMVMRQGGYLTRLETDMTIRVISTNKKDTATIKLERGVFKCLRMS